MAVVKHLPEIPDAVPVTFGSGDVTLGGYTWWGDGIAPAFLLLHGWGEDASTLAPVARQIRARSWHAISISMRGWLGSSGVDDYGLSAAKDIGYVVAWIRQQQHVSSVVLLGFSMGGLMAGLAAAEQKELTGLIAVSSPSDLASFYSDTSYGGVRRYLDATLQPNQWRDSSPLAHAHKLVHPMLVVTGTLDLMAPPSQGKRLAMAVPNGKLLELNQMGHHPSPEDWNRILAEASLTFEL
ncbi:alpha/beta hydrolase family protein [Arthrobacter sp. H14]|uniref:alpha/beta hydrolase family protein n=1 Tax=Arthrobacter sp. H14 TaxID=1312959 RepID=UPI00047D42C9|nr:alpha/beta fold hydrolase [Arthrobacter sp. H14]